jgi:anaerobic selenocysteine-containing dehydrogenase
MADEILTPGEGQVRGFVTVAGNPVLSSPNGGRLDEAFDGLDFMVSVDYYLNETTRHADVILPPTAALERSHYELIFPMLAACRT